jgi:hypothetical protein
MMDLKSVGMIIPFPINGKIKVMFQAPTSYSGFSAQRDFPAVLVLKSTYGQFPLVHFTHGNERSPWPIPWPILGQLAR